MCARLPSAAHSQYGLRAEKFGDNLTVVLQMSKTVTNLLDILCI